jgi:hypothetical protein
LICAGKNGGTIGLCGVRDRVETIQALVFGGPFLDSGDDRTPCIFAFVLGAYVKLALFLVATGVFVVISVAHGGRCIRYSEELIGTLIEATMVMRIVRVRILRSIIGI